MRAHLLQMNIAWEDRHENFRIVRRLLESATPEPGDLIVLPELFDSGFSLNTAKTHDASGETLTFLQRLATELHCTVHGSRTVPGDPAAPDPESRKATNRATIIGPTGLILTEYAKIHPFSFGREPESFRGGETVHTYPWESAGHRLTVCPAVCYDLRFPELFRQGLALGADAFVLGANWPAARQTHWRALAIARAIENQSFVLAVNRTGSDPHLAYAGGTIAVGPKGDIIGELTEQEAVLTVNLDPADTASWRAEFGAWRDIRLTGPNPGPPGEPPE